MRNKGTIRRKLPAAVILIAAVFAMIPADLILYSDAAHGAETYSYTCTRPTVTFNGEKVRLATFTVSGKGLKGTCCQAGAVAKSGKTTVRKLSGTDLRTKLIYYYGYQKGYLGKTNRNGFLLGRALSWASGVTRTWPATKKEVRDFIKKMPSSVTVPNRFEAYFCNPSNGGQNFIAYKMNPPVYITLKKTSADKQSLSAGSGYTFRGVTYTVYDGKGNKVGTLTCKDNGTTNKLTLDTGTYTVKETKSNAWYKRNTKVYKKTLKSGQTWTVSASDSPQTGTIQIRKTVTGDYDGSLAFAFKLTNLANAGITYKVKTDGTTGKASVNVLLGTYRCEEILPADSGLIDMTGVQKGTVKTGQTVTFQRENKLPPSNMLRVTKTTDDGSPVDGFRFKVSGKLFNQGTITKEKLLDEAKATLTEYDESRYTPGNWTVSEDDIAALNQAAADGGTGSRTVRLSNRLKYKGGNETTISEILEDLEEEDTEIILSKGALIRDRDKVYQAKEEVAFAVVFAEESDTEDEESLPIDLDKTEAAFRALISTSAFEAVDASDLEVTAEVRIGLKPVEFVTNTEDPDLSDYEKAFGRQIKNKTQRVEEQPGCKVSCTDFDWYGAATEYQEVKDGRLTGKKEIFLETAKDGQTPAVREGITFGSFTVTEVMNEVQQQTYRQPEPQTIEVRSGSGPPVFRFAFENKVKSAQTWLEKTSPDGNIAGITFRVEGKNCLGEAVALEGVTDTEGRIDFGRLHAGEYVVSEQDFDAARYENHDQLEGYDVPARRLTITGGETEDVTVRFENTPLGSLYLTKVDKDTRLFLEDGVYELSGEDRPPVQFRLGLDDYGQAEIELTQHDGKSSIRAGTSEEAAAAGSSGREAPEDGETQQETYNFGVLKGLREGGVYTIREITAPDGYAATVDQSFEFHDGQKLILENTAPQITTTATDQKTESHMSNAEGVVTITDRITYRDLSPGKQYLVSGVLAYRPPEHNAPENAEEREERIEVVKDSAGKDITAWKRFTPESGSGSVEMEFTFDGSQLDGRKAVAMEQILDPSLAEAKGIIAVIASHEDMDDPEQTILFPKVETRAAAEDTSKQITRADQEVAITDTVVCSNVEAGQSYEITGTLMDRDTGKPVLCKGRPVTASAGFRAEDSNTPASGRAALRFRFDGSQLSGKKIVVFEKLTAGGKLVGEHSDLNDEAQFVSLPAIDTTASISSRDTVKDKIEYKRLLPGEKYIIRGILMDRSTGEKLLSDGQPVTTEKTFVPAGSDGSIEVAFPVSAMQLQGKSAVVFETCSLVIKPGGGETAEVEVISHKDLGNQKQTVTFDVPQTGQAVPWAVLLAAGLLGAAPIVMTRGRNRKGMRAC